VSLSFDDGQVSQLRNAIPVVNDAGVKATFYLNPWSVERYAREWKEAAARGHEIGNHTSTHPCSKNFPWSRDHALEDFTLERMKEDIAGMSALIRNRIGVKPTTFAYPCGQTFVGRGRNHRSYVPLVARMFLAGRGFNAEFVNDPTVCDLACLGAIACDERDIAEIRPLLDRARQERGWLVLAGHHVAAKGVQTTRTAMLRELCAYVTKPKNGFWCGTIAEIARYVKSKQEANS
jgi:peptidoglycan/xylan/chitin deacetylase (PgdA/CDA1 family)